MSDLIAFVTEHWRTLGVIGAVLAYFGWDKAKALVGKIKLPSIPKLTKDVKTVNSVELEAADVAAIAHLRNRAVEIKDEALLVEIKSVAAKFFDLHSSPIRDNITKSV